MSKLKTAVKNNEGATLKISSKMVNSDNLPHELFLTTRQTTKPRNAIEQNTNKKIILSGGTLGSILGKLAGPLLKIATRLARKVSPVSGLSAAMSGIDGAIKKNTWLWDNNFRNFKRRDE